MTMSEDEETSGDPSQSVVENGSTNTVTVEDSSTKLVKSLSKQASIDIEDPQPPQRSRANSKVKLLQRSHAMREEQSPPRDPDYVNNDDECANDYVDAECVTGDVAEDPILPDTPANTVNCNNINSTNQSHSTTSNNKASNTNSAPKLVTNVVSNHLTNNRPSSRHKLRHQGSSHGSIDSVSPCLSRDSSTEQYTDNSGVDLTQFLVETLNRSAKDRPLLFQIELDMVSLVKNGTKTYQKFPTMSSYQRMLVHRVAAYFGMDHNVDQSGTSVIVNTTPSTRIPDVRFSDMISEECRFLDEPRRSILKRDSNSFDDGTHFKDGVMTSPSRCSQRSSQEDINWRREHAPWSSDSDISNTKHRPHLHRSSRLLKVESFEGHDTLKANSLRGSVSKSYSFGGYPGSTRADSISSSSSRHLVKQDSASSGISSRFSPSSGYKSQSQRSETTNSATPSPNPNTNQASSQGVLSPEPDTVIWAVSSLNAVPAGAVLINPTSGQPYVNPDGSIYRFDPDNPIKLCPTIEEDVTSPTLSSPTSGSTTVKKDSPDKSLLEVEKTTSSSSNVSTTSVNEHNVNNVSFESHSSSTVTNKSTVNGQNFNNEESKVQDKDNNSPESTSYSNVENYVEPSVEIPCITYNEMSSYGENKEIEVLAPQNGDNAQESVNMQTNRGSDVVEHTVASTRTYGYNHHNRNNNYEQTCCTTNTGAAEYISQNTTNGAYYNPNIGLQQAHPPPPQPTAPPSITYGVPGQYANPQLPVLPDIVYRPPMMYTTAHHPTPYNLVTSTSYESRSTVPQPPMPMNDLNNYYMGLSLNGEQATAPAAISYWPTVPQPPQNIPQNNQGSQQHNVPLYYLPTSTGAFKYVPTTQPLYTYNNVPPVVYTTDPCRPATPSTQTVAFTSSFYPPPTGAIAYNTNAAPVGGGATGQGATQVAVQQPAPQSYVFYHAPAPVVPTSQYGIARPPPVGPGARTIRTSGSPPLAPRTNRPTFNNRSNSERGRRANMSVDTRQPSLHYSTPMPSMPCYGIRLLPGDLQGVGLMSMRPNCPPIRQTHLHNTPNALSDNNQPSTRITRGRRQ